MSHEFELELRYALRQLCYDHNNRFTQSARAELVGVLTTFLVGGAANLSLLFPDCSPEDANINWDVRKAQNVSEETEYTEAARGLACGHIFRPGESSYHCRTCTTDETCVLCARCYAASDHEGHAVYVTISPGNSGCCDCGDEEAWIRPVKCGIHSADAPASKSSGKAPALQQDVINHIRATIGIVMDFLCDVLSCAPEQLRLAKTEASVRTDERLSQLSTLRYGGEVRRYDPEFCLVLWNDEKHTVDQVQIQVARACQTSKTYGLTKANEVNDKGRSIIEYSRDVPRLLEMARVLEQIKVSVTIRSARDTFREHMCETMVEWLAEIAGCRVGSDPHILRNTICEQFFKAWAVGSSKQNETAGSKGIYDHEMEDQHWRDRSARVIHIRGIANAINAMETIAGPAADDADNVDEDGDVEVEVEGDEMEQEDDDDDDGDRETEQDTETMVDGNPILRRAQSVRRAVLRRNPNAVNLDAMDVETDDIVVLPEEAEIDMDLDEDGDEANEMLEATMAGYPPPPPPPPANQSLDPSHQASFATSADDTGGDSEDAETVMGSEKLPSLPKTPTNRDRVRSRPPKFWLTRPSGWLDVTDSGSPENLNERMRIDFMILYDLRLWKTLRDTLRHLLISTLITMPEYKRLLAIRFAGLYTLLAQLYLIADREPDHSIINLSLQILTTPSLTSEVVVRANFLTQLWAIFYTFLTTRQVGYPRDIMPNATLAFDAGAIANRRMYHFFVDAKYVLQSPAIQERIRAEPHYLKQFLDLVKLHQGICPNKRAVGEHVEYETDTWLSASLIMKDINKLLRLVADAFFVPDNGEDRSWYSTALKEAISTTTISSLGLESDRFVASELKRRVVFESVKHGFYEYSYVIPNVSVLHTFMSFHHPLHHTTSWLLQAGKHLSRQEMRSHIDAAMHDIVVQESRKSTPAELGFLLERTKPYDWVSAMFDPPLRVCVWLSQMRAGMWVRNGMTLRHQMNSYRSASQRDFTYQRDLFMLQAGLVLADDDGVPVGSKFLTQIIHRYDLQKWLHRRMELGDGYDEAQHMDVIEDFFHLLVILLTERDELLLENADGKPSKRLVQRDIAHALCFRPLSYSDIIGRLTERTSEFEQFDETLEEMCHYKPPEGLNDHGLFELKSEFVETIDPYYAFYTRNQREEADNICRERIAKSRGVDKAEVVLEPRLPPITDGLFKDLPAFTRTTPFVVLIAEALHFAVSGHLITAVSKARMESVLQLILQLILLAVNEDAAAGFDDDSASLSFIDRMVGQADDTSTIHIFLKEVLRLDEYSACHAKVHRIFERSQEVRPRLFKSRNILWTVSRENASTPVQSANRDAKKQAALARQARVMAQFKQQQSSFMTNQGLDWEVDDFSDEDKDAMDGVQSSESEQIREWPADACILCQEEANEERLHGCFGFVTPSVIQRQTPIVDMSYVAEVVQTPENLDRSAEAIRPFGRASQRDKSPATGPSRPSTARSCKIAGGFREYDYLLKDNVVISCGHMMHHACFETYLAATARRQAAQISRNHPENMIKKEYLCPLCKALGNVFLPVIWKPRQESYPGLLGQSATNFAEWLTGGMQSLENKLTAASTYEKGSVWATERTALAVDYVQQTFSADVAAHVLPESSGGRASGRRNSNILTSILDPRRISSNLGISSSTVPGSNVGTELRKAYKLFCESIELNCYMASGLDPMSEGSPAMFIKVLQSVASSVAAVEIQQRGIASQHSLLTGISDQVLTNLRVYCETVSSLMAIEQLSDPRKTSKLLNNLDIFGLGKLLGVSDGHGRYPHPSPLRYNTFWNLTLCSFLPAFVWRDHGHNLIQLALLAEVVKVVLFYSAELQANVPPGQKIDEKPAASFQAFLYMLGATSFNSSWGMDLYDEELTPARCRILYRAVKRHSLIFLRKVLILMHVKCGVDFTAAYATLDSEKPELDRLCTLLRIPTLAELFNIFSKGDDAGRSLRNIVKQWLENDEADPGGSQNTLHSVDHPAITELIGLPRTFDTLTEEAVRCKCPTTGKPLNDSTICLLCGEIFCSQANCCRVNNSGGASRHMKKCGFTVGLFINIRKCVAFFLHDWNGSWTAAPYLDKYGEPDPALRRHHQLFLNQKRYDKLMRDVWLSHGIPSVISRKLEGDVNNGGWETL